MIRINKDFTINHDSYGWWVAHTRDGVNPKTKEATRNTTNKYFGTLAQCCMYILDASTKPCESVAEVLEAINAATEQIRNAVQPKAKAT